MIVRFALAVFAAVSTVTNAASPCSPDFPQTCSDVSPTECESLFLNPDESINEEKCYGDEFAPFAALCRSTCKTCCKDPAYACKDKSATGHCSQSECNKYPSLNYDKCQGTCGWCQFTAAPCVDTADQCSKLFDYCTSIDVAFACPVTCKQCSANKNGLPPLIFTGEPNVDPVVPTKPATKAPAPTTAAPAGCIDIAGDQCAVWIKTGYCTNPLYAQSKYAYCKKSCGLC